jgi:hypothetical protein
MGLRESKVNLSWPCYVRNNSVIVKSIIRSTSRIESADCGSVFDVAHCSILKCNDVTWRADPSSNSACRTVPVGLCLVSESTNILLGQHRGPSWYPDPHTACSLLRELLWTGKQKKCFCQACGGVPTLTPKAILGNDLRPIGQEVASDHRSHFLQDTHTHKHTHARMPSHTRARTHNIRNAYSRPSFCARRVHAT